VPQLNDTDHTEQCDVASLTYGNGIIIRVLSNIWDLNVSGIYFSIFPIK